MPPATRLTRYSTYHLPQEAFIPTKIIIENGTKSENAADNNPYKDYYSDDDDLFSFDDVSHSELRDMREALNALTAMQEAFIPTIIIIENGTKSQRQRSNGSASDAISCVSRSSLCK